MEKLEAIKEQDRFVKAIRRMLDSTQQSSRVRPHLAEAYAAAVAELADLLAGKDTSSC
jgi:hypothetical protein